jgi:DNA-binding transcriptional LysR family regulator
MRWMAHRDLVGLRTVVDRRLLAELPIVTLSRDSDLFLRLQEFFREEDSIPERLHVCNTVSTMMQLVACGFAAAVLPTRLASGLANVYELAITSPMATVSFFSVVKLKRATTLLNTVEEMAINQAARWMYSVPQLH